MLKLLTSLIFFALVNSTHILGQYIKNVDATLSLEEHDNTLRKVNINSSEIKKSAINKSKVMTLPFLGNEREFTTQEFSMWGSEKSPYDDVFSYKIYDTEDPNIKGRLIVSGDELFITYLYNSKLIRYYSTYEKGQQIFMREVGNGSETIPHSCGHGGEIDSDNGYVESNIASESTVSGAFKNNGSTRRSYRVAVVVTGEYFQFSGNLGLARGRAIANLSDISAIFENELAIELVMATGSPELIYNNPNNDIFDPNGGSRTQQANDAVEANFNERNYDIGHVFHVHSNGDGWATGGVAGLGVVCRDNQKARGWSGAFSNTTNSFVNLAAHEFGHQFNATHSWNGIGSSCDANNYSPETSYEIASGTTIMSYNGICQADNNIPSSGVADNYFHVNSLDRMINYVETFVCNENLWIADNNTPPVSNANPCNVNYVLPRSTPFILRGEGTDADGDNLTYCWEQYDPDPSGNTQGEFGTQARLNQVGPLFRSFPPVSSSERVFPNQFDLVDGTTNDDFEVLPAAARTMNFRLTVRDNNPAGGGIDWDQIEIDVVREGPLELTFPDGRETLRAGETIDVTWNTRGGESLCDRAVIRASFDGGFTFPITLASDVPYAAGTQSVFIPGGFASSEEVRFMIMCDDYECFTFFDISDRDFTIESDCEAPNATLCDTEDEEFNAGDPGLELNLGTDVIQGNSIVQLNEPGNFDFQYRPGVMNVNGDCIVTASFPSNPARLIPFQVTEDGNYNFVASIDPSDVIVYTIYEASRFDPASACDSYIVSNATFDGGLTFSAGMSAPLEACVEYLLVPWQSSAAREQLDIFSIRGPGSLILVDEFEDFSLTFTATDRNTGVITMVDENADFRGIQAGVYDVEAVSFKSGGATPPELVDPSEWIGRTSTEILNEGQCFSRSFNDKQVTVISTCEVQDITLGTQTACDPNTNTYSQTLSFFVDRGPTSGTVEINGQQPAFEVNSQNLTVTLTDLPADGAPVDLSFVFSEDGSCNRTINEVFNAPENCCPINIDIAEFIDGCRGTPLELDAGADGMSYSWSRDGIEISSEQILLADESIDNAIYTVVVDNGNCTKGLSIEVNFNDVPTLGIGADVTGCDGNPEIVSILTDVDSIIWMQNGNIVATNTIEYGVIESGTVEVIATNEFGCSVSSTFESTFANSPVIELGEDQTLCEGTPLELMTGDSGNSYQWFLNNIDQSVNSNVLNVTTTGEYIVIATNSNNCPTADTVNIIFTDLPELQLGDDVTPCASDLFTIQANANGFDLSWFLNDDLQVGATEDEFLATESGIYIANVSAGVDCEISDTIIIDYIAEPEIDLGDDRSACPGEPVNLDGGDANNNIIWSSQSMGTLPTTDNMLEVTTSDTYFLSSTNDQNCESLDTVTITFTELPDLDISDAIEGSMVERCVGDTYTIEAESNGFMIEWFDDNGLIIGETESTLTVSESGTYRAVVSANATCSIEDEVNITFNVLPIIDMINDRSPCEGDDVVLTAGANGAFQYIWTLNNAVEQEGDLGSFNVTQDGEYIVTAINEDMCEVSDTAIISFIETPIIMIEDDIITFCEGTSTVIESEANATIEWFFNDELIANQSQETLEVFEAGEYIGLVGGTGTCATSDTITVEEVATPIFTIEGETQAMIQGVLQECTGDEVTLTIEGRDDELIEWRNGGDPVIGETDETYTISECGMYSALLINIAQCTTEVFQEVIFFGLAQNEISQLPPTICEGDIVTVDAETTGSTFTWSRDGIVLTDEDQLSLEITESDTYTFTGLNEIGCETSTEFVVEFNSIPNADLGEEMRAECIGIPVNLSVEEVAGNSYIWTMNSTPISDDASIIINDDPGDYAVTVTDSAGCSDTGVTTITFNEPPMLDIELESAFCEGLDTELTIDTDASAINWLFGADLINENVESITVNEAGTYTVEVISDDGCTINEQVVVTEIPNPVIPIENIDLCPNESMDIIVDDDFISYEWIGITATGPEANVVYEEVSQITTENASLTVVDVNGCTSTEEFTITFNPVINATVADDVVEICIGESANLGASGGNSYLWDDPNGSLDDPTSSNPIATPDRTTTYDVEVSDDCPGNIQELTVVVVVNNLPIADAGLDTCALIDIPFQLQASGGTDYSWDNRDLIEGSDLIADPIINIDTETIFTVTVTDENGCESTDQVTICVNDPIDVLEPVTVITPNGDGINDELLFRGLEAFPTNELTIFNRWGVVVFKKLGYQNDDLRWTAMRGGEELPADTYYYILTFEDVTIKKSITVIRN